ncbi:MAG: NAD(P)-dependent oxidoreductase [Pseudomonadota bacterium]
MKILVTGSSGWLGRFLIPLLWEAGQEPYGVDIVASDFTDSVLNIADADLVQDLFREHDFDGVIHAAALHKPDIVRYPEQTFVDVNVTGTLNLLKAASERGVTRFVFTSTTSLMISQSIRDGRGEEAIWLDEDHRPLEPRNIYGVTKLAAESLFRMYHIVHGLNVVVLRTSRFFPEEDDTIAGVPGPNLKANELLNRRATVGDMARAHLTALDCAPDIGFGLYIVSAPTPFQREHTPGLKQNASAIVADLFPDAPELYAANKWKLPDRIDRIYDGTRISRDLGFEYDTTFTDVLDALRDGYDLPIAHDPAYTSPITDKRALRAN